jgi:hypothetical protein
VFPLSFVLEALFLHDTEKFYILKKGEERRNIPKEEVYIKKFVPL